MRSKRKIVIGAVVLLVSLSLLLASLVAADDPSDGAQPLGIWNFTGNINDEIVYVRNYNAGSVADGMWTGTAGRYGVYAYSTGSGGIGVYGSAPYYMGVYGRGEEYGTYGYATK